jgi:hypothetical protein
MTLLLSDDALRARGNVANSTLASLADGLTRELELVMTRELYVPNEKAVLSREGGRCPRDGTTLEFDPFSPHRHRCGSCGEIYTGVAHDRFWIFWYQLWLAERALHGALLGRLRCNESAASFAASVLDRYADRYLLYPNRDNVLGPTRPFFSTYLESIWLLNLSIAADLLEVPQGQFDNVLGRVRDRIIEPSSKLIASYDEGASNRQVWNDAALFAANRLLGRNDRAAEALLGKSGIVFHLQNGLLADGTWYEGENYHLFAHRGLWYGITMAEAAGVAVPSELLARFGEGFATPFLTMLPDLTLPSRRDSQYAISVRQPRFAELCELGIAREKGQGDARLRGVLYRLYGDDGTRGGGSGRARSTADVERNLPATGLTRGDLGWRSLLFARPDLPVLAPEPLGTVLLDAQGLAVFRRADERVYIALDYGASGGGHGHPDRLNVLLSDATTRWLDDMGTGSYVDASLHWYRSTLAHNAPRFNGSDQQRVDGELLAFDEHRDAGWVSAEVIGLAPGVAAQRTLVAMSDYVLDELVWQSDAPVALDLPMHVDPVAFEISPPTGTEPNDARGDLRDSLGVIRVLSYQPIPPLNQLHIRARHGDRTLVGIVRASAPGTLFHVTAPGAPSHPPHPFLILHIPACGKPGWIHSLWSWTANIENVSSDDNGTTTTVDLPDGSMDRHARTKNGWRVECIRHDSRTLIELRGLRRPRSPRVRPTSSVRARATELRVGRRITFELGREQYRQAEETWDEAGKPTATVNLVLTLQNDLELEIDVRKLDALTFVGRDAVNAYDNESPDINGDGVQLYFANAAGASAWILVPEAEAEEQGKVRTRVIDGWETSRHIEASWRRTRDGYQLRARIVVAPGVPEFALGVVINEKPPGRERRRGQLVLAGAPGEFVYLRGDREERERLPRFHLRN